MGREQIDERGQALAFTGGRARREQRVCVGSPQTAFSPQPGSVRAEGQTDRGRQSGGQRGTDRLSTRQRHAQSPPSPTQTPQPCTRSAARKQLLRRSRWRTRWRPGTAPIHELQHRKTQGVRVPWRAAPKGYRSRHSWQLGSQGWRALRWPGGGTGWDGSCSTLPVSQCVPGGLSGHTVGNTLHLHAPLWGTWGLCCPP